MIEELLNDKVVGELNVKIREKLDAKLDTLSPAEALARLTYLE